MRKGSLFLLFILLAGCRSVPAGFVSLHDVDPSIIPEIRYAGEYNFAGDIIDGYEKPKCLLTRQAADALVAVQKELEAEGYTLRVYDCYRPERAVRHFVRWAKDVDDTRMKQEFYPDVEKQDLFAEGYIAEHSSHSRGSTVDLTIDGLDMGTPFDFFSPLSHTENPAVGKRALANRRRLQSVMNKHGFVGYDKEWWHFTLKNEPFPDTAFDFVVQ